MNTKGNKIFHRAPILSLVFASIFLLSSCAPEVQEVVEIPDPLVNVLDLAEKPKYEVSEVGTVKAVQEIELIAKSAGTIGTLDVKVGDPVTVNQVLAVIDFDESNNPAKINYDNAQIQLSNARQTYSEVRANNQDSITRAGLRVQTLETTLGRLQRNLEELFVTNDSTKMTLEFQLENAEKNLDTAEVNYQSVLDTFDLSWIDLLNNVEATLDSVTNNLDSDFSNIENIINPSRVGNYNRDDLPSGMGDRNSIQRNELVNEYRSLRVYFDDFRDSYYDYKPLEGENVADAIDFLHEGVDRLRDLSSETRILLNNSVVNSDLSQTSLDLDAAQIVAVEASVKLDITSMDGLTKSIASFKIDRVSQVATADNNRIIASNQLADANNGLIKFQTSGTGSVRDLEASIQQTQNDLLSTQADLASAKRSSTIQNSGKLLEINTYSNQLRLAEKSLEDNQVVSSINGVLSELVVDEGDYVSPGTYLGKVIQHEQVKVVFYVSKENSEKLNLGQPFSFIQGNNGDDRYWGTISKISPSASASSKKILIEGVIDNENFFLKPETFINLKLDLSSESFDASKTYVPMNSIIFAQNAQYVYVVEDGLAVRHDIEIGEVLGVWIEVTSGLSRNETLIVEGHRNLPPNGQTKVNVAQ